MSRVRFPFPAVLLEATTLYAVIFCGNSSVVERNLAKVDVAGPIPVSRSKQKAIWSFSESLFLYTGAFTLSSIF